MSVAIWWIRRDLRLSDNQALLAAVEEFDEVIPLFIVDPKLIDSEYVGEKRIAFLWKCLNELDAELRKRESRLFVREGPPHEALSNLYLHTNATQIIAEADFSPYARNRDKKIAGELPLRIVGSPTLRHPEEVLKADGSPYIVYTPYKKSWRELGMPSLGAVRKAPEIIKTLGNLDNGSVPNSPVVTRESAFPPGENPAKKRLEAFTLGDDPPIFRYSELRNRVDLDGTSQLSPYLRFGMISTREAIAHALVAKSHAGTEKARKGVEIWIDELIWREFYSSILYHFPNVREESFRPDYRGISWINDKSDYQAWCEGQTGFPIVDAAMRQLTSTGWMHNRARMIVASFLVKDLLVDWRWGEKWFMQHLIDGDPSANNGGWQWTAGTGTDSAPYFRVFNPTLQSKKFDPKGDFIRKWVPELANIPLKFIHEPEALPIDLQKKFDCQIGVDYPHPIIDHKWARERVLEVYGKAKG